MQVEQVGKGKNIKKGTQRCV